MIVLLLPVLAIWHGVAAVDDPCPPSGDVYPCYCETDYTGYSYLLCEKLQDMKRVGEVLTAVKGKNISLSFSKMRFGAIASDIFQGQVSEDISFDHCKIHSFGDRPFSGLENTLKKIYIYGSIDKRIKDLETFPLSHLKKLGSLSFQANDIVKLGNEWFADGPAALVDLSLEANDIEEIGDRAFASLVNLEQIWLGDNRFRKVYRSMFPNPAPKLFMLEISFNGIEVIPEDLFTGMPTLRYINVSGNKLVTLSESTYGHVWNQLEEVYVYRNYGFECDEKIRWIYQRKLPKILDGACYGSNALRGKKLEDLTLKDFDFYL